MHEQFEALLDKLVEKSQVGPEFLAEVLARTSIKAPEETSRLEIASAALAGSGRVVERTIPQGTVSKAVRALLKEGLLDDGQTVLRSPDGHRVLAPLRLGRGFAIGGAKVTLRDGHPAIVTAALTGLDGQILVSQTMPLDSQPESEEWHEVARVVHSEILALKRKLDRSRTKDDLKPLQLFGVGVEVGAHVHNGVVIRAPGKDWHDRAPLGDMLEDLFEPDIPIIIENDVNALAVHATHSTHYPEPDLAVVAVMDEGVGGGLVMDGRLRRGGNGMAMEIGHLTVGFAPGTRREGETARPDPSLKGFNPQCPCGAFGHLDAFAAPRRIRERLGTATTQEAATAPATGHSGAASTEYEVFRAAGAVLGRGIAHVINIVNPSKLILCVPAELSTKALGTDEAGTAYLTAAKQEMNYAYSTGAESEELMIEWPLTRDEVSVLGARAAATCVLESFIDHARGLDGCQTPQRRMKGREPAA